jgi:post-segregation antitoxin (ccd killing protein)
MQVTVNIPDELAAQAREKGLSVEVYVEQVLASRIKAQPDAAQLSKAREAIDRMAELRKGVRLDGLKIKDLIDEGRKY